jgi:uncharacterized protein (DUF1501 family)
MNKKSAAPDLSRRQFIGGSCCAAVGATGLLSALGSLRLMGAVASPGNGPQTPRASATIGSDYKALVCLFLNGGNDANNMIVPADTAGYAAYAAARANLALPQTGLLPISPRTSDGHTWALHPSLPELQKLFGSGKAALLANVGTLAYPTTKTQYRAGSVPLPLQLFSHADQQVEWQTSVPDRISGTGWGGRLADLVNAFNTNNQISMSISLSGSNHFQIGTNVTQYAVTRNGAVPLTNSSATVGNSFVRAQAQKDIFAQAQPGLLDAAFGNVTDRGVKNADFLNSVLGISAGPATPGSMATVTDQLKMVAQIIAASPTLGLKRQIFFVQLLGWDTHAAQLSNAAPNTGAHANLLAQISAGIDSFYTSMTDLGIANQVTLFTASDFGRTLRSNGDGSDHGWGNHQIIVGGAVKGGDIYGKMPTLTVDGPDDTSQGRWIPTTSVDEYAATLATWFGVSATDLPIVLPNIGRFQKPNLGFL